MSSQPQASDRRPHRLQGAMFLPIGDAGRAELVERRISEAITGGHLRAGDRLPSEADLARTMGVAPVTVREALLGLRSRGLVVTRRGRNGGSFVSEEADPLEFARETLLASSRFAIRDLGVHYAALTMAGVRLAARRSAPVEVAAIRSRLGRLDGLAGRELTPTELGAWRQTMDDLVLELVALSQSARLTRDQMRLQAEFSPLLRLIDVDAGIRVHHRELFENVLGAVESGDEDAAGAAIERLIADAIDALDELRLRADDA
nr:GntR family transcriptional regulator [Mycetocola manganoxydans]